MVTPAERSDLLRELRLQDLWLTRRAADEIERMKKAYDELHDQRFAEARKGDDLRARLAAAESQRTASDAVISGMLADLDGMREKLAAAEKERDRLRQIIEQVERQSGARNDLIVCAMLKKEIASWPKK